jgi:L-iditol 2-dehydrogenase
MARELGAHTLIDPTDGDPVEQVKALTDGRGADVVIVAVGHPKAIDQGLKMAGINGRVNLFAGTYPPTEMPTDPNLVHYKQIILTGSHDFTPHHFTMALKLIQYGIVRVAPLISHTYDLDQIVDAFEQTASQRGLKSMVRIA